MSLQQLIMTRWEIWKVLFDLSHLPTYILPLEFLTFQKSAEDCCIEVICIIISSFLTWNHEASFKLEQHNAISINTSMSPETQKQYWHMMTNPSCSGVVRVWLNNQGNGTNNYKLQWIRQSKDSAITVLSSYLYSSPKNELCHHLLISWTWYISAWLM